MSFSKRSLTASTPSEPPAAVCSSSGRGFAPPSERTNRPCKDRHLSKLLQLAIAICQKTKNTNINKTTPKDKSLLFILSSLPLSGVMSIQWYVQYTNTMKHCGIKVNTNHGSLYKMPPSAQVSKHKGSDLCYCGFEINERMPCFILRTHR